MTHDIETIYGLLAEGRLDMMYLPSGALAWLWVDGRPRAQVQAATRVGVEAHKVGNDVVAAKLLAADHNVLVLHIKSGQHIMCYPDGGYGVDGQPYDFAGIMEMIQGVPSAEQAAMAVDGAPMGGVTSVSSPLDVAPEDHTLIDDLSFDLPDPGLTLGDLE